jgi:hypothetical protein
LHLWRKILPGRTLRSPAHRSSWLNELKFHWQNVALIAFSVFLLVEAPSCSMVSPSATSGCRTSGSAWRAAKKQAHRKLPGLGQRQGELGALFPHNTPSFLPFPWRFPENQKSKGSALGRPFWVNFFCFRHHEFYPRDRDGDGTDHYCDPEWSLRTEMFPELRPDPRHWQG